MPSSVGVRRGWHAARFAALVVATLLAAHDAIYALRFGTGSAFDAGMAATGHGYWGAFTASGVTTSIALVAGSLWTLARLRRRMTSDAGPAASDVESVSYAAEVARLWPRLLAAVAVAFVGQESLEHLALFGHLPSPEELLTTVGATGMAALAVVSFVVAAVGSLVRWRIAVLRAHLAISRARFRRASGALSVHPRWALVAALRRDRLLLVRLDAGRAPPRPPAV